MSISPPPPFELIPGMYVDRCRHDMVADWCSICKHLPDVPIDLPGLIEDESPTIRWVKSEQRDECSGCYEPIKVGEDVHYSPAHGGTVGRCCGYAS